MDKIYRDVKVEGDHAEGQWSINGGETWISFKGCVPLMVISEARDHQEAYDRIWALQDGYGSPGLTPPQGRDWSGIRDSSDKAHQAMYEVALEYVPIETLMEMLGVR